MVVLCALLGFVIIVVGLSLLGYICRLIGHKIAGDCCFSETKWGIALEESICGLLCSAVGLLVLGALVVVCVNLGEYVCHFF